MTLYDYPEYYEIAFAARDSAAEARFLQQCIERYSLIPVNEVFEVACGSAPHAGELAGLGYQYTGLDRNRNMLDHAARSWQDARPRPRFIEADLKRFSCQHRFDFAFVMSGSLYLNSREETHSHFDSLASTIRPGGLYFLDWCVQFDDPTKAADSGPKVREKSGIRIETQFNIRLIDSARQMYEEVWTVNVNDRGRKRLFELVEHNRAVYPQEFLLLIESRPDFEFVGWWVDWDLTQPADGRADVRRPVVLLRRK